MRKNLFRDIKKSISRFISLLAITLVGVATFTGVLSVSTMMQYNGDQYFNKQNLFDGRIIDPLGISDSQVDQVRDSMPLNLFEKAYTLDMMVGHSNAEIVGRVFSGDVMNQVHVVEGESITNTDDCLVDTGNQTLIGQRVSLTLNIQGQSIQKTCNVTGSGYFPQVFSRNHRGVNSLGNGRTQILVHVSTQFMDEWVGAFIEPNTLSFKLESTTKLNTFSSEYLKEVEPIKDLSSLFSSYAQIQTRRSNESVEAYYNDSSKINEIAAIFPVIFFIVAALVGATIMSRMIDDQRTQLGLYSALGYSRSQLILYYALYASFAVLIGSGLGVIIGFNLIPRAVMQAYRAVYQMSTIQVIFVPMVALVGGGLIFTLIVGIASMVAFSSTKETAAALMRQKAPIAGKHIFLEHIPFIWNRLSFMNKVSSRNLLRYKKRLFMTLFGILGCSALLMTGFGLQSSITPVVKRQFEEIIQYQGFAIIKPMTPEQFKSIETSMEDKQSVDKVAGIHQSQTQITFNDEQKNLSLTVGDFQDLNNMFQFFAHGKSFEMNEQDVILSKKMAQILGIHIGDTIEVNINNQNVSLTITNIMDLYIGHYLFVDPSTFDTSLPINQILVQSSNIDEALKEIESINGVMLTQSNQDIMKSASDSMKGLNNVVYILIGFAAMLVFIVMFSLTSINLSERRRELATLKVLGFYEGEVASYVFKENMILTIVGSGIGLVFGHFLHLFVVTRAEMPELYFIKAQPLMNYVLTFGVTVLFSLIVSLAMRGLITKIDMIDSLKSNE